MKDWVLSLFFVVSLLAMFVSGFLIDRGIRQQRELDKVYEQIEFVCGSYKGLLLQLRGAIEYEKKQLTKIKREARKQKRKGKRKKK